MKEIKFIPVYVSVNESKPAKCAFVKYDDGRNVFLYSARGLFGDGNAVEELKAAGVGMHSFPCAVWVPSATVEGLRTVCADVVVFWPGSVEFNNCEANKQTRPGGRNDKGGKGSEDVKPASGSAPAPAVTCWDVVNNAMNGANFEKFANMVAASVVAPVDAWAVALLDTVTVDNVPGVDCSKVVNENLNGFGPLAGLVAPVLVAPLNSWLAGLVSARVDELKAAETIKPSAPAGVWSVVNLPGKYQVTNPAGEVKEFEGLAHDALFDVLNACAVGVQSYLYGPAGTGKTTLASQVAAALGRPFCCDNKICNEYAVTGFVNAAGQIVSTEFRRAYEFGAVYLLDEADASDECALTALNKALDGSDFYTFPDGQVKRHPDFIALMAGNTIGRGADSDYTGRNCLDAATLNRFANFVEVGYNENIDRKAAAGVEGLCEFARALRDACAAAGVQWLVTPRNIQAAARCHVFKGIAGAIRSNFLGGLEIDQVKLLQGAIKGRGIWFDAFKEIA